MAEISLFSQKTGCLWCLHWSAWALQSYPLFFIPFLCSVLSIKSDLESQSFIFENLELILNWMFALRSLMDWWSSAVYSFSFYRRIVDSYTLCKSTPFEIAPQRGFFETASHPTVFLVCEEAFTAVSVCQWPLAWWNPFASICVASISYWLPLGSSTISVIEGNSIAVWILLWHRDGHYLRRAGQLVEKPLN